MSVIWLPYQGSGSLPRKVIKCRFYLDLMAENLSYNFLDPMTEQCLSLLVYHDLTMVVSVGVICIVL